MGNKIACEKFFGTKFKSSNPGELEKEVIKFIRSKPCKIRVKTSIPMLHQEVANLWVRKDRFVFEFSKELAVKNLLSMIIDPEDPDNNEEAEKKKLLQSFADEPDHYYFMIPIITDKYHGFSHWGSKGNSFVKDKFSVLQQSEKGPGDERSALGSFWMMYGQWITDIHKILHKGSEFGLRNVGGRFNNVRQVHVKFHEGSVGIIFSYPMTYGMLSQRPFVLKAYEVVEEKDFVKVPESKENVFGTKFNFPKKKPRKRVVRCSKLDVVVLTSVVTVAVLLYIYYRR